MQIRHESVFAKSLLSEAKKSPKCFPMGAKMDQKATKKVPKTHPKNNFGKRCLMGRQHWAACGPGGGKYGPGGEAGKKKTLQKTFQTTKEQVFETSGGDSWGGANISHAFKPPEGSADYQKNEQGREKSEGEIIIQN